MILHFTCLISPTRALCCRAMVVVVVVIGIVVNKISLLLTRLARWGTLPHLQWMVLVTDKSINIVLLLRDALHTIICLPLVFSYCFKLYLILFMHSFVFVCYISFCKGFPLL